MVEKLIQRVVKVRQTTPDNPDALEGKGGRVFNYGVQKLAVGVQVALVNFLKMHLALEAYCLLLLVDCISDGGCRS